jgi:hypothetical protein
MRKFFASILARIFSTCDNRKPLPLLSVTQRSGWMLSLPFFVRAQLYRDPKSFAAGQRWCWLVFQIGAAVDAPIQWRRIAIPLQPFTPEERVRLSNTGRA